ncbi:hypothetical protein GBA52_008619 [Prunus armeniaca]|nr:hypothetical protein GBA52_008619 [Prunus armeniaca]
MIENKELKVMFKETATIQTPAKRRWDQQIQADIIAKSCSRSLNFEDEYLPNVFSVPLAGRPRYNCKTSLKNSKSSLHILTIRLLHHRE